LNNSLKDLISFLVSNISEEKFKASYISKASFKILSKLVFLKYFKENQKIDLEAGSKEENLLH